MDNERVKIKEDALRILETDSQDTIRSLEQEHLKSSFALGFAATFLGVVMDKLDALSSCVAIPILLLLLGSVAVAIYNLLARSIPTHTNVDKVFEEGGPTGWEKHLHVKYESMEKHYRQLSRLLKEKSVMTKISFACLFFSALLLIGLKIYESKIYTSPKRHSGQAQSQRYYRQWQR